MEGKYTSPFGKENEPLHKQNLEKDRKVACRKVVVFAAE
jgi:hypothetical protein